MRGRIAAIAHAVQREFKLPGAPRPAPPPPPRAARLAIVRAALQRGVHQVLVLVVRVAAVGVLVVRRGELRHLDVPPHALAAARLETHLFARLGGEAPRENVGCGPARAAARSQPRGSNIYTHWPGPSHGRAGPSAQWVRGFPSPEGKRREAREQLLAVGLVDNKGGRRLAAPLRSPAH